MRFILRLGLCLCACVVAAGCETTDGGGGFLGDVGRRVLKDQATQRVTDGAVNKATGGRVSSGTMSGVSAAASQAAMLGAADEVCGETGTPWCRNLTGTVAASFTAEFIERMTREDLEKAAEARKKSIETGEPQVWENPESGASGKVETKPAPAKPPEPTPIKVEEPVEMTAPIMDAVGEPYVVTAASGVNVRRGPGTQFPVVMKMASGERFNAIAKLQEDNWYLVGKGTVGKGYASGDLIGSAPVELEETKPEPEPAAATKEVQVAMAAECYTTTQSVTLGDGTTEEATVTSCRTPDGWVQV
ncbi:MAG: SH3 domain-containing protein [Gammaproteobacteria bacterium]